MAKISLRRMNWSYRGWGVVFVLGVVLTALALLDGAGNGNGDGSSLVLPGGSATADATTEAGSSAGCRLQVTAPELRVRSAPGVGSAQVQVLHSGDVVDGTRTVTDGFRRLEGDRWAADQFLAPLPNTNCA
jgi:hypothetical protein